MFNKEVAVKKIFTAEVLEAGGTATSEATKVSFADGFHAVQFDGTFTGSASVRITYSVSLDNVTFQTPASASDIVTSTTADGYFAFSPEMCKWIKIIITETGQDTVTVSMLYGNQ